jgi:hypothetical protein
VKRHQLAYFLSGFGLFVFACTAAREQTGDTEGAASLSPGDEYLASEMLSRLPPKVAASVRSALDAAPGPKSQHALIEFFGSDKIIELSHNVSQYDCTPRGDAAVIYLADWARTTVPPTPPSTSSPHPHDAGHDAGDAGPPPETPAQADDRIANDLTAMTAKLATADITQIDNTLTALTCANSSDAPSSSCANKIFTMPQCASGGDDDDSCPTTVTTCAINDPVNDATPADLLTPKAADRQLASLFHEADAVGPSRAMQSEWNALRDRYHAGLTQAARATLRTARYQGSATLKRDASARRRFDEAGRMADAFAKSGIAMNVDAMNLLHAAISSKNPGQLREIGQDAAMGGRGQNRRYLPGATVAQATTDAFAMVKSRRANGEALPAIAASFDQRLISIHPYADANGRTTRLMTDWILAQGGYPPALDSQAARAAILLWERPQLSRGAHLEHITEGMRRSVELVEALS